MDSLNNIFMPPQASTVAGDVDRLFHFIFYITLFFFILIVSLIVFFSIRYRRKKAGETTSGIAHNTALELLWTIIPAILVIIIFAWGFKAFIRMSIVPKDAIEIKVTAQRWMWKFDYPDGLTSINELVVPLGKPVKLLMSSTDVIHSFYVPGFRIKKDVLPNRYTIAWFEGTAEGTFDLYCAEYCGKGHSEMLGKVRVVPENDYRNWLATAAAADQSVPLEQLGSNLFVSRACNTCHSVTGARSVGPTFLGLFGHEVQLTDGGRIMADENYLRRSILEPQAQIVTGFQPVMPTYQGILSDREIDALIAYIKSLGKE